MRKQRGSPGASAPKARCGKGAMRKQPGFRAPAAAVALLLLLAIDAGGQELTLTAARTGDMVVASASFLWHRQEELTSTLRDGLESRITFTVRVYEKKSSLLPFIADRLVAEEVIARNAFYDFLDGRYVIETDTGARASYTDVAGLLADFLSLPSLLLPRCRPWRDSGCYVAARVRFDPVRLMPPLTIVSLVGATATVTTPWVRKEVLP